MAAANRRLVGSGRTVDSSGFAPDIKRSTIQAQEELLISRFLDDVETTSKTAHEPS
jgi:hypothetical protein